MKSIPLKPKTDLTQSTLKAMVTSNPAKEGCKSFLKREDRTLENSQTDRSQKGGVQGRWQLEKISQRIYLHIFVAHGHKQQCGEGGGGGTAGWRGAKLGENGGHQ